MLKQVKLSVFTLTDYKKYTLGKFFLSNWISNKRKSSFFNNSCDVTSGFKLANQINWKVIFF